MLSELLLVSLQLISISDELITGDSGFVSAVNKHLSFCSGCSIGPKGIVESRRLDLGFLIIEPTPVIWALYLSPRRTQRRTKY
jgi:hypothetical protein